MLLDLACTEPPATPILTLAEAKAQARVDHGDDDAFIGTLVDSATSFMDGYAGALGRALVTQTWRLYLPGFYASSHPDCRADHFPPGLLTIWPHRGGHRLRLPLPPLQSVVSIGYVDAAGDDQTLDPSLYQVLDGVRSEILPAPGQQWPDTQLNPRAVTITFIAGYGDAAANVPAPVKAAMKLLIGHWYANREAVVGVEGRDSSTELPLGVRDLISLIKRTRA